MKYLLTLRNALLFLALLALLSLPFGLCVSADETTDPTQSSESTEACQPADPLTRISDGAALLTEEECEELALTVEELARQYGIDAVIVTVHSLQGKTPAEFAGDFYDEGGFGYGEYRDGMLMLLAMESRDYYFLLNGCLAGQDYGPIEDDVLPYLSNGDYYVAFNRFLSGIPALAEAASYEGGSDENVWYDAWNDGETYGIYFNTDLFFIFTLIGIAAGFLTTYIMTRGMKTARAKDHAMDYVRPGSFNLHLQQDIFLYHTRKRVRIQSNSSGGSHGGHSGGGGGGRSGGGGKF